MARWHDAVADDVDIVMSILLSTSVLMSNIKYLNSVFYFTLEVTLNYFLNVM